jgi:hydroxyethylthiazole kinase-like uncharacterized protein yjeF
MNPDIPSTIRPFLQEIKLPAKDSHKGQNGKLLIIGGSELFHAASKWSLDVASKIVDMVFYSSVPANNELILKVKGEFWNGIVIPRSEINSYIEEADAILIGPGMDRSEETKKITNELVSNCVNKKWVIDAGALQMIDATLLQPGHIITPHHREIERLNVTPELLADRGVTIVLKGRTDEVWADGQKILVEGGNAGMTKGGTGDVLAGLVAALYTTHTAAVAAVVGSYVNKLAGDTLYDSAGPYFNASELAVQVPKSLWECVKIHTD